jgi:CheY-like chemotaxis protein/signal transduction histidine kinase
MLSEVADTSPALSLLAGYAIGDEQTQRIEVGKGLVGQCALEKQSILITKVPRNYTRVHSSLGAARPKNIVVLPVLFEGETKAVIELSSLQPFTQTHLTFLEQLTESIGVVLNTIEATMRTENLLQQSQQLTMELQTRQSELQQTNEELASKAKQLAEQNVEVERKNKEVEQARRALEEKAAELALTSKYKSEFLANMSHELRTPLNSILILGQQLAENSGGNLTGKQVDFARNIHSAGTDLLTLINDILDLSKIESGTVTVEAEELTFGALRDSVERNFHHLAESKSLAFQVEIDGALPRTFSSDPKRLQQILKNLLSNAFKFTSQGGVSMRVRAASSGWSADHPILRFVPSALAIDVRDTGIGIAPEKQRLIFEAFQQADAGTSRKYGGTGLGLAISRELATLLGGEIRLVSAPGQGSTFTLYLPFQYTGPARAITLPAIATTPETRTTSVVLPVLAVAKSEEIVPDDRESIAPGDNVLLIVDDDAHYARVLLGLARDKGFKGIVANRGQAALSLAKQYLPTAVTLDVFLPDMLGWTVLNNLKLDPATRHIPVQMLSVEEERQHGLSHGAFSYLVKPATTEDLEHAFDRIKTYITPHRKRLLVVEDNDIERESIVELLAHDDIDVATAASGFEALDALAGGTFDCCVVDLRLPDMTGFELLERMQADPSLRELPVVVFTGKALSQDEESRLKTVAKSIVLKDVQSPERLFDETALFLHRVVADLPPQKRQMLERLHGSNDVLRQRKVLVVDDDARNIFALTTVLENQEMEVISATNGRQAIDLIRHTPDLSVVLMDIMMPAMDGYETMRQIRKVPELRTLPIVALTAKAMKGDREKCLEAGASDYIAKPVNTEQLLSLLRVWLYR